MQANRTSIPRFSIDMLNLIQKYDVGAPRYTSYPTVPHWNVEQWSTKTWMDEVANRFHKQAETSGIAIYVHLPFCEDLCTYCGCNTRITKNHGVEVPYLESVIAEWQLYKDALGINEFLIEELHLGGGTPTFFSATNLHFLVKNLLEGAEISRNASFSFEAHPANTTNQHLTTLFNLGFTRLSLGIQDFDPVVQKVINRYQTTEDVNRVVRQAREIGYTSINFDLVYGLPLQTIDSLTDTVDKSLALLPDRISFYSYAHVPWVKPGQRKFTEIDLPDAETKIRLYSVAKEKFQLAGYKDVGMDHFALPGDTLFASSKDKTLHRNFMGYTDRFTPLLIGLGVSSISDSWGAFAQNEKKVEVYQKIVASGEFPVVKGHVLTEEDKLIRTYILQMMCQNETKLLPGHRLNKLILSRLEDLANDDLVKINGLNIQVLSKGRSFLRNICMAFDQKINRRSNSGQQFSKAI